MNHASATAGTIPGIPPDRVTDDALERMLCGRDLAAVPGIMSRPFFRTLPDVIVRPADTTQVAEAVRYASRQRIAVTPRAAATTSYYDAVPVRGGMVLDLNGLRGLVALDPDRQTARVLPGTTWFELDEALGRQGYTVKSYPSSAVAATVGGWVSTQGHGIGSLRYGPLGSQIIGLEVVLPDGEARGLSRESDPPAAWFVAAEGTLGVVTEVELTVRPLPAAESHHLLAFADFASLQSAVLSLCRAEDRPFTIFFADGSYLALLARAGFQTPLETEVPSPGEDARSSAGRATSIALASFQGDAAAVGRGRDALLALPGRELPGDVALAEWALRLYHLRCKRAGPSLLAAEQWLPLAALAGYLRAVKALAGRHRLTIGTYGYAVTPEQALVMSIYPADERRPVSYLAAVGLTKRLHDLGARHGGRPYGVGLWNTPYLARLFNRSQLAELRRRKARLDPTGIMNPGKLYGAPFPLWPATFALGAGALSAAHSILQRVR